MLASLMVAFISIVVLAIAPSSLYAQAPVPAPQKEKPTKEQILKMKIEDLLELPLEDVMELVKTAGVSTLEELINLIVTTASKSEETMQDAGAVIYVVTAKEIESYGANSLFELIDRVCNTYTLGTYLYTNNIVSIRGNTTANNTNTLLLLDGRPMRESYANGFSASIYNGFPLDRIERIEIVRGPGSVLYGTCALTGVINIITKRADKQGPLNAAVKYGSFGTKQGSISGAKKFGELEFVGGLQYLDNKGWDFTARGESDFIRNKANTLDSVLIDPRTIQMYQTTVGMDGSVRYKGFSLSGNYTASNQAAISRNARWHGQLPTAAAYKDGSDDFRTFMQRGFVNLGYEGEISSIWNTSLNATYNGFHIDIGNPTMINDLDVYNSHDFLVEWTNFIRPVKELNILVGGLINKQTGYSENYYQQLPAGAPPPDPDAQSYTYINYPNTTTTTTKNPSPYPSAPSYDQTWWSAYIQAEYRPVDFIKLIIGGQFNKVTRLDVDFVPRLGTIIHFAESFGLKVLYGQAYRSPSVLERNFIGFPVLLANSALKPEKIATIDAQLFYSTSNAEFYLTYYHSNQTDIISRALASEYKVVINNVATNIARPINRGSQTSDGIEFEGKYNVSSAFSLVGSASWQTTRTFQNDSDTVGLKDNLGMPKAMVKLGVNYNTSFGLSIGVFNSFFGDVGSIATATTRNLNPAVEAYSYLSANVTYDISGLFQSVTIPTMKFSLYGTNLLDAKVYYSEFVRRNMNSIPGRAGRAIYAGFSIQF